MKHRVAGRRLDRTTEHRTAMFRNMVISLLRHERIVTTTPKAKELKPAVAVVDIGMPGMNGYELTRALRREFPSVRIHLMTGPDVQHPVRLPLADAAALFGLARIEEGDAILTSEGAEIAAAAAERLGGTGELRVRRMGFAVDESDRAMAERVGAVVGLTAGALALLALLMCGLAALAIGQSLAASVRGRVKEIAILQAVGATAGDVRALILAEAGILGLAGGLAGVALARLGALAADSAAARALPDFPFRPGTYFSFPAWLLAAAVAVAVVAAVAGAVAPAAAAARVDPARTIA